MFSLHEKYTLLHYAPLSENRLHTIDWSCIHGGFLAVLVMVEEDKLSRDVTVLPVPLDEELLLTLPCIGIELHRVGFTRFCWFTQLKKLFR